MMRKMILLALLGLAACNPPPETTTPEQRAILDRGDVALIAVAPDGTKLWAVRNGRLNGRLVYFASSGSQTSHNEACGKNCNKEVDDQVPLAQ
jgi:hypothetical protein